MALKSTILGSWTGEKSQSALYSSGHLHGMNNLAFWLMTCVSPRY